MADSPIKPEKITKPIQIIAIWFVVVLSATGIFLTASVNLEGLVWLSVTLAIFSMTIFLLTFLGSILMLTKYRHLLQDDEYYSGYLKENFKNFSALNSDTKSNSSISKACGSDLDGETKRINIYNQTDGLFLTYLTRPSKYNNQVADIIISLCQHREGPLTYDTIEKVEYFLGPKFQDEPYCVEDKQSDYRIDVTAYGPFLCFAKVYIKQKDEPIELYTYVEFSKINK